MAVADARQLQRTRERVLDARLADAMGSVRVLPYRTNYDSLDTVTELIACFIVPQACSSRVFEPPLVLVHTVHVSKVGHPNT